MKHFYTIDRSEGTTTYWQRYYLCDNIEEYKKQLEYYRKRTEQYNAKRSTFEFDCPAALYYAAVREGEIHGREYYQWHNWCGFNFDADGFTYTEICRVGCRSQKTTHIIFPGTVRNQTEPQKYDPIWEMIHGNS